MSVDNNQGTYNVGDALSNGVDEQNKNFRWIIESISSDKIVLRQNFDEAEISGRRETIRLNEVSALQTGRDKTAVVQILDVDTKRQAYITILPGSGKAISRSVVDVKIPVERRAIQFNTEQIDWQINKTRAVIKKLDSIINKLDTTVKVWKGTCLGVFAFISLKNLATSSIDGETRNLVMKGIDERSGFGAYCNEHSGLNKEYTNYDECIFKNQAYIEKRMNEEKQNIINANNYAETNYITEYANYKFDEKSTPLVSKQDARELKLLELQVRTSEANSNIVSGASLDIEKRNLESLQEQLEVKQDSITKTKTNFEVAKEYAEKVSRNQYILDTEKNKIMEEAFTVKLNELSQNVGTGIKADEFANLKPITFVQNKAFDVEGNLLRNIEEVKGKEYIPELDRQIAAEVDSTKKAKLEVLKNKINKNPEKVVVTDDGKTVYNAGGNYYYSETEDYLGLRIRRTYARPNVAEYYENGRPFCVPTGEGNYVRVLEYYEDGTAKTVDERNVGTNGIMCDEDDVIINSDSLVKLNPPKEQELKRAAARAGNCASGTYKVGNFVCSHARAKVTQAVTKLHCTDVMSISDCKVLFNVCDPVMCPTSRFNLGGKWQVNSVPETGIIGSSVLGLPNFGNPAEGGVVVPICLPGVLSGLEGIRSVFQGYEQCLQTSKVNGQTVGICDKVKSVFICENVWREAVAITGSVGGFSAFSGKLFGSVSGGGEYAPNEFGKRLKQTSDSAKFFASDYATSSLASYEARSLGEVGSQICRNIYAGKAPGIGKLIDQITTPESPPQFTAFFDEYPWSSDAGDTRLNVGEGLFSHVQEQSRYSVFYHIYAGRATDVRYSVYLKDRLGNIVYVTDRAGGRSRGFISREEFASKNIDFIGKSGFTEICVEINGRETCGFGRSSTDFGINYLNDKIVTNELQKEIHTKEQCVPENKVGPTLKGITTPIVTPENINTGDVTGGIVRVCSHQNPGEGGNEAIWQVVGTCGEDIEGIDLGNCWIDTTTVRINDLSKQEQTVQNIINKYDVKNGELILGLSKEEFSNLYNRHLPTLGTLFESKNPLTEAGKQNLIQVIGTEDDESSLRFIAAQSIDYGAVAQLMIGEIYLTLANDRKRVEGVNQAEIVVSQVAPTLNQVTGFYLCKSPDDVFYCVGENEGCYSGGGRISAKLSKEVCKKQREEKLIDTDLCAGNTLGTVFIPWNNRNICHQRTKGAVGCYYDSTPYIINKCGLCKDNVVCSIYKDLEECQKWDPCVLDCEWKNNKCLSANTAAANAQLNKQRQQNSCSGLTIAECGVQSNRCRIESALGQLSCVDKQNLDIDLAQLPNLTDASPGINNDGYYLSYIPSTFPSNKKLIVQIKELEGSYYIENDPLDNTYPLFRVEIPLDKEVGYVSSRGSVDINNGEFNEQILEKIKIKPEAVANLFSKGLSGKFDLEGNQLA